MDWYPLWNSLRIALVSCAAVFFLGIFAAYYIAKLPRTVKGALDVVLTLPMVLPPTVVGYFLLLLFGAKRPLGAFFMEHFGVKLVMNWYSAIFASIVVAFPLMYRTARGAFESFDETLAWSAQTLGQSDVWIFWRVRMPCCRQGILAGTVLAFARALGEYGATSMIAGYTPGKTATIATTVYQLWRTNDEAGAMQWVLVDIVISAVVLLAVNLLERRQKQGQHPAELGRAVLHAGELERVHAIREVVLDAFHRHIDRNDALGRQIHTVDLAHRRHLLRAAAGQRVHLYAQI